MLLCTTRDYELYLIWSYCSPMKKVISLSPHVVLRKALKPWGLGRANNLPNSAWLLSSRAEVWTQANQVETRVLDPHILMLSESWKLRGCLWWHLPPEFYSLPSSSLSCLECLFHKRKWRNLIFVPRRSIMK